MYLLQSVSAIIFAINISFIYIAYNPHVSPLKMNHASKDLRIADFKLLEEKLYESVMLPIILFIKLNTLSYFRDNLSSIKTKTKKN